jgi:hypothetical protein
MRNVESVSAFDWLTPIGKALRVGPGQSDGWRRPIPLKYWDLTIKSSRSFIPLCAPYKIARRTDNRPRICLEFIVHLASIINLVSRHSLCQRRSQISRSPDEKNVWLLERHCLQSNVKWSTSFSGPAARPRTWMGKRLATRQYLGTHSLSSSRCRGLLPILSQRSSLLTNMFRNHTPASISYHRPVCGP